MKANAFDRFGAPPPSTGVTAASATDLMPSCSTVVTANRKGPGIDVNMSSERGNSFGLGGLQGGDAVLPNE